MNELFQAAAKIINDADAILICAGAGMGVDSGLPDFRGNEGFWRAYPPLKQFDLSFVEMAQPRWFDEDPHFAWGFYGHRTHLYRDTHPHQGFAILLNWLQRKSGNGFVFTSNVDGHFQKAGFDKAQIVECHGAIGFHQCAENCSDEIWPNRSEITVDEVSMRAADPLPSCDNCRGIARPNILLFGDGRWNHRRTSEQEQRYRDFLRSNAQSRIAVVEIGAGTAVPTVRFESERLNAALIRINPREPQVHHPQAIGIACGALEAIAAIDPHVA